MDVCLKTMYAKIMIPRPVCIPLFGVFSSVHTFDLFCVLNA